MSDGQVTLARSTWGTSGWQELPQSSAVISAHQQRYLRVYL